jgi:hypothetical protein
MLSSDRSQICECARERETARIAYEAGLQEGEEYYYK